MTGIGMASYWTRHSMRPSSSFSFVMMKVNRILFLTLIPIISVPMTIYYSDEYNYTFCPFNASWTKESKIHDGKIGYVFEQAGTSTRTASGGYEFAEGNVELVIKAINEWEKDIDYLEKFTYSESAIVAYWESNIDLMHNCQK